MTQEELDAAVQRLIVEANEKIAERNAEYENAVSQASGRAISNRTARSTFFDEILAVLKSECSKDVLKIQKNLDESLAALYLEGEASGGGSGGSVDAPYEVDYSLPMRDRYVTVKNYYLAYEDKDQAYTDALNDEIAKDYLGEFYENLLQLLKMV